MKNLLFTGIDVSKDSFDITIINQNKEIIMQNKFEMNSKGFKALSENIAELQYDDLLFVMESTGVYHLNLYFFLVDNNFKAAVVNPLLIHNFAKSVSLRKTKTDKKDAETIADFALSNYQNIDFSNKIYNSIRNISRERDKLAQNVARLKTEIKNVLQVLFPELSKHTNVFTKTMLRILLKAPGRFPIMKMKPQQIARSIKDESLETVLILKIKRLIFIIEQINDMNDHLRLFVKENLQQDFDILNSIKGIGVTTAEKFLIEIANIENFKSHNQLRAYIGTDPSIKQSGSSINVSGRISKRGNAYLRKTIWQMAVGVIRCCPHFADYYHKKISEGKKYKQAVIAVANKLIKTLYAMLKNKTCFRNKLLLLSLIN
jgi:transposase